MYRRRSADSDPSRSPGLGGATVPTPRPLDLGVAHPDFRRPPDGRGGRPRHLPCGVERCTIRRTITSPYLVGGHCDPSSQIKTPSTEIGGWESAPRLRLERSVT